MKQATPKFQWPTNYPSGGPLYWTNEVSGRVAGAVKAFLKNRTEGAPMSAENIEILRGYFEHWINAPCWQVEGNIAALRKRIEYAHTADDLDAWLRAAEECGIDPL